MATANASTAADDDLDAADHAAFHDVPAGPTGQPTPTDPERLRDLIKSTKAR